MVFIMKKQLSASIGSYSIAGRKAINQDFHGSIIPDNDLLNTKGIVLAVADGISSSDVSQIASETSIKSFLQDYYSTSEAWSVKTSAQRVLSATNSWLFSQSQQSPHRFEKDKGYICTFSAVIFKSNTAYLIHSGDSRILRITGQRIEQLTRDHRRTISADVSYLTRGLGIHNRVEIDYQTVPIVEGDIFLLATDGVYEFLSNDEIIATLTKAPNLSENNELAFDAEKSAKNANHIKNAKPEQAEQIEGQTSTLASKNQQQIKNARLAKFAKRLVEAAYAAGSDDNLTLQIAQIEQVPEYSLSELHDKNKLLPPAQKLQPRKHFDGYDILRELYLSSRSHVYLAKNSDSGEQVVLKTPSTEMKTNSMHLDGFLMEEWIIKRINNAHIIKAVDVQRKRNFLYTVTEYIEGKTLAQWITDNPAPSIDQVRPIIEQVAKGLRALHRQEIVHQDIRPNNIMIDLSGTVKIIDMGSAKVAGISEIAPKNEGAIFTAQYAAPEYFLGQSGTSLSDVFSLGVMTYQMLSGNLPYGNDISKTHNSRTQQRLSYRPLLKNKEGTPAWIDYAIKKAVDIDPQKRYQEVSEFIHDLNHPSARFLSRAKPPLLERNPVLFWQGLCVLLVCALIYQSIY